MYSLFYLSIYINHSYLFNMSYLTDSYISFTLKLESRQNFCSKSLIRSSTYSKKMFLIFLHAGRWLNFLFSSKRVSKMNQTKMAFAWRNFKNIFLDNFSLSFLGQRFTDSILRVKIMYESLKYDVLSISFLFRPLKQLRR